MNNVVVKIEMSGNRYNAFDFDGNKYFDYKKINLEGLELDPNASIYLYYVSGNVEKRFDLGTVSSPLRPHDRFIGQYIT